MSGITGIYYLNGSETDRNLLEKMTRAIAHRGPDDEGFHFSGNLGLGHKRLAIVDLSKAGHQPMVSGDGSLAIVHDGQVYNSPEIRQELEQIGYRFRSNTDTEVILHSYKEWGVDCLNKFNGMWAFAVWDKQNKRLFCARDRFGAKPFYYYFNGEVFIFASEIKAILEYPGLNKIVNEEAVYNYLMWGLLEYSEDTFFKGIKELRPSHYLLVGRKDGLDIRRWWSVKVNPNLASLSQNDAYDAVGHLRLLMEDAVRISLRTDVPVGTCLSGGLDSSSVAMLVNRLMTDENVIDRQLIGDRQKTFSSCYQDERCDERLFIEKVLQATGAEGNYVFPDGDNLWEELPLLIWHNEEPCETGSAYAHWKIMQRAKARGVKVLLDGDGGDELLAGYHRHYSAFLLELALTGNLLRLLAEAKDASAVIGIRDLASRMGTVLRGALYFRLPVPLQLSTRNLVLRLRGRNTHKILAHSFDKRFSRHGLARVSEWYKSVTSLQQSLYRDLAFMTRFLQPKDRSSAAFSIEARAPFLDYRLVEYSFSLPASLKIRNGWTKWILRQAMQGVLPEEIRLRKDKLGFPTPIGTWLRSNRERIKALFSSENALSSQFINLDFITDNLDDLLNQQMLTDELWRCINVELWLRVFFSKC